MWGGHGDIMPAAKQGDNMSIRIRYRRAGVAHPVAWVEHQLLTLHLRSPLLTQRI